MNFWTSFMVFRSLRRTPVRVTCTLRTMDLNYAKWDKVGEESSNDSSDGGNGASGSRGTGGCGDPTCCGCGSSVMSGFFDDLPEHMKGMGMFGSGNGNPSRQMAEMMMGAVDPATGAPRPDVMARAAFAAHAVASGTMCGRDGPDEETKESAADDDGSGDDGDVPSLESMTSSEDGADDLGSEGESNGTLSGIDSDKDDEDDGSDGIIPFGMGFPSRALGKTGRFDRNALYEEFVRVREFQQESDRSVDFWLLIEDSVSSEFTDYYTEQILRGRPAPKGGSAMCLPQLPRGFAEFACFVGQMEEKEFEEKAGWNAPAGFHAFAKDAEGQTLNTIKTDKWKPMKNVVKTSPFVFGKHSALESARKAERKESKRAAEQAAKLSGRTKTSGSIARRKARLVEDKRRNGADPSGPTFTGGGFNNSALKTSSSVADILRRDFETGARQRGNAHEMAMAVETTMRVRFEELSDALDVERQRNLKQSDALDLAEAARSTALRAAAIAQAKALESDPGNKLSVTEALDRADALKRQANVILADTRYPEAVEHYTIGIQALDVHVQQAIADKKEERKKKNSSDSNDVGVDSMEEDENEDTVAAREMLLMLLCNRSLAHLKWGNLGSAKQDAQRAMDIDPRHIKAYFRRAAAHKQAERYREALSDLRYMLRLEPPPGKGVPVSDDILAVQKMARECEQKVRAKGFKKALEETKSGAPAVPASVQKEAKNKWDEARGKGKRKSKESVRMPKAPKKGTAAAPAAWEDGVTYLPPKSELPTLKNRAATVAAESINRAPEVYVHWCKGLLSEYLTCVFERLSWVALQTMMFSGLYDEVVTISSNAQEKNWWDQDQHYRRMYASISYEQFMRAATAGGGDAAGDFGSPQVLDPHLGLVDVMANHTLFNYQAWDEDEKATPKVFNFEGARNTGRAVVSWPEFVQQFNIFTEGQLSFMDWNNVVVAGGSVLAAMQPPPPGPLREFYHTLAYRASDVDLFIYGLDEKAATAKVRQLFEAVKLANPKIFAVRTLRTITFVSEHPHRKVQIVLRLYKTLAEVLHGFDVDACSVGFDGNTVWATNRASRAICKRYNVVDITRRSPSYESRLFKYGKRGYAAFVRELKVDKIKPSLQHSKVHPRHFGRHQESGLGKLVAMDVHFTRFNLVRWGDYFEQWHNGLVNTLDGPMRDAEDVHQQETRNESDYTTMFIPYGPKWDARRTRRHINNYISAANSWYYRFNMCDPPQATIQPAVCGPIDLVLNTGVNTGENDRRAHSHEDDMSVMHMRHVTGGDMWLKVNPGAQGSLLSGSFHPIHTSLKAWEKDAYA